MEIEWELNNNVFHDPRFVDRFLSGNELQLETVLKYCRTGNNYNKTTDQWRLPTNLPRRLLGFLNMIKNAVHNAEEPAQDQDAPKAIPTLFQSYSSRSVQSDIQPDAELNPKFILFQSENKNDNWETVKMAVALEKTPGHRKAGLRQLSHCARMIFAHQIHRRHFYSVMVCGLQATFVRFDRAGILYSNAMDLFVDAKDFIRAFASLLMLDRWDEGFDTAFITKLNKEDRLVYYIDLPEAAFAKGPNPAGPEVLTRRLQVRELLCHRREIYGRATIVLRLRDVVKQVPSQDPEPETQGVQTRSQKKKQLEKAMDVLGDTNYILKIIWRFAEAKSEGPMLERVEGMYGLVQHLWHRDVPGRCKCSVPRPDGECPKCVEKTVQIKELQVCNALVDIGTSTEDQPANVDPEDTTRYHPSRVARDNLTYSYVLMSSVGVTLDLAYSPREFMSAIADAIIGYWQLLNLGLLHRDISCGNVLILNTEGGQKFTYGPKKWLEPLSEDVLKQDNPLARSKKSLHKVLMELDKEPVGILADFDLCVTHSCSPDFVAPTCIKSERTDLAQGGPSTQRATRARNASDEGGAKAAQPSKRRRLNLRIKIPENTTHTSTANAALKPFTRRNGPLEPITSTNPDLLIDYRAGTQSFMSIHILSVKPGNPCVHSFLDDVESFFWLIYYSAAWHLDAGMENRSKHAKETLHQLDESGPDELGPWKTARLKECSEEEGSEVKKTLKLFKNEWASDPLFVTVITKLGQLCWDWKSRRDTEDLEPYEVLPAVIMAILGSMYD